MCLLLAPLRAAMVRRCPVCHENVELAAGPAPGCKVHHVPPPKANAQGPPPKPFRVGEVRGDGSWNALHRGRDLQRARVHRRSGSVLCSVAARSAAVAARSAVWRALTPPVSVLPARQDGMAYASTCVVPIEWREYTLRSVREVNHDTSIFTFALPAGQTLGLPTCACLLLRAAGCEHGGGDAVRPYTPISDEAMEGGFELLVKRYQEWGDKRFPHSYKPAGAVSNHVFGLKQGDTASFKHIAFNVKIPYTHSSGHRGFRVPGTNVRVRQVTMIAVGVGIAPMIQALHTMLGNPEDTTQIRLLYGNRSVRDILMKDLLDKWELEHARFSVVHHIGSRFGYNVTMHFDDCPKDCGRPCKRRKKPEPEGFSLLRADRREFGWVSEETLRRRAFPPTPDGLVFVCGLPSVYEKLCGPRGAPLAKYSALHNLGYEDANVIKF